MTWEKIPVDDPETVGDPEGGFVGVGSLTFASFDNDDPVMCNIDRTRYYFFDETWGNLIGPFSSESAARQNLDKYMRELDGERGSDT